jgi:hypothetical protein
MKIKREKNSYPASGPILGPQFGLAHRLDGIPPEAPAELEELTRPGWWPRRPGAAGG